MNKIGTLAENIVNDKYNSCSANINVLRETR